MRKYILIIIYLCMKDLKKEIICKSLYLIDLNNYNYRNIIIGIQLLFNMMNIQS